VLLTEGTRFDQATRGGFVLVTSAPVSPEQRAVLSGRGTEALEVRPGSALHQWLADGRASAALVRPDFTVMRAGRDVGDICAAAPKFLPAASMPAASPSHT
jgi:3-(3-hydroxy-phenyl)propionate hydroxylase